MKFYKFISIFVTVLGFSASMIITSAFSKPDKNQIDKLKISNISTNKLSIDSIQADTIRIRFDLSALAKTTINILNMEDSKPVVTLEENKQRSAGSQEVIWDGKDTLGKPLPSGVYRYSLIAKNANNTILYDPSGATRGLEVDLEDFNYDPQRGNISFKLNKPSWVRVRMIKTKKMLIDTPWQWKPLAPGKHVLQWDGWDRSHARRYVGDKSIKAWYTAMTLPRNGIIVNGPDGDKQVWSNIPISFNNIKPEQGLIGHSFHHMGICYDPPLKIYVAGKRVKKTADGTPIVKGKVLIKIEIPPDVSSAFKDSYFLTRYYIDDAFLSEDMRSVLPQTFMLDTTSFTRGVHVITVNCLDFFGHVGNASLRFHVQPVAKKRGRN